LNDRYKNTEAETLDEDKNKVSNQF